MRTCSKLATMGLVWLAIAGKAGAEQPDRNRDLHLAIAMQGDQALVEIRGAMLDAIPLSIRSQMKTAITAPVVVVPPAPQDPTATRLAALTPAP